MCFMATDRALEIYITAGKHIRQSSVTKAKCMQCVCMSVGMFKVVFNTIHVNVSKHLQ